MIKIGFFWRMEISNFLMKIDFRNSQNLSRFGVIPGVQEEQKIEIGIFKFKSNWTNRSESKPIDHVILIPVILPFLTLQIVRKISHLLTFYTVLTTRHATWPRISIFQMSRVQSGRSEGLKVNVPIIERLREVGGLELKWSSFEPEINVQNDSGRSLASK